MNRKKIKRPFVKKEDIAFWFPIDKETEVVINKLITRNKEKTGMFVPPYQMILKCIRECAREMNKYGKI